MNHRKIPSARNPLHAYLAEIRRIPLLSVEEEQRLARRFQAGDASAGHQLVAANLRFVVKVAFEYRAYGLRMPDMVQEGNLGLLRAVQKFDPDQQVRLISYAVWWIRTYLQNHILRSWSLVKLGTTQAQRRLFFSLARTRRELSRDPQTPADRDEIARSLSVKTSEVEEMSVRLEQRDQSLDLPKPGGATTAGDRLPSGTPSAHDQLADAEARRRVGTGVKAALARLDERERYVVEQRLLAEPPLSLSAVGDYLGISRERARQLELRATGKLKVSLAGLACEAA